MTVNSVSNFLKSKISGSRLQLAASSQGSRGSGNENCPDNFYEKWKSVNFIAFMAFVQFRKNQHRGDLGGGGQFNPHPSLRMGLCEN